VGSFGAALGMRGLEHLGVELRDDGDNAWYSLLSVATSLGVLIVAIQAWL